jgi:hypothetical protein
MLPPSTVVTSAVVLSASLSAKPTQRNCEKRGQRSVGCLTAIIFPATHEGAEIIVGCKMPPLPRSYPAPLIYKEDWEIDRRLVPFLVTRPELVEVARAVVAGRADAVDNDPLSAEGLFAYIFGTRSTRALLRRKGWLLHRAENIESVRHPKQDWLITYQSVDLAATVSHWPRAISGKGAGADRFIDAAQGELFPSTESISHFKPENLGAWFYCVSVNGDDVRAELSRPIGVGGGNFDGFMERIFIIREGEWSKIAALPLPKGGTAEFEPIVTRK